LNDELPASLRPVADFFGLLGMPPVANNSGPDATMSHIHRAAGLWIIDRVTG
jgi:hypothetical protein